MSQRFPTTLPHGGGIKEKLRLEGGAATREQILEVLEYCWRPDRKFQPNPAYLDYAIENGWLFEG